jgi:Poxvirus D5 protein-like
MEIGEFFRVASRTLYEAYKTWCVDSGEKIESQRVLGLRLKDRGLTNEKATAGTMKGRTEWIGIKLK